MLSFTQELIPDHPTFLQLEQILTSRLWNKENSEISQKTCMPFFGICSSNDAISGTSFNQATLNVYILHFKRHPKPFFPVPQERATQSLSVEWWTAQFPSCCSSLQEAEMITTTQTALHGRIKLFSENNTLKSTMRIAFFRKKQTFFSSFINWELELPRPFSENALVCQN